MFERFTEKARRTIFFARYEANLYGSAHIETEHFLLGLLREDKALASHLLRSHAAVESIRSQIDRHTRPSKERVSTTTDVPLSHECKRALAYGAEESQRLNHQHIGTGRLFMGLMREEKGFAAQILRERGFTLAMVRERLQRWEEEQISAPPTIDNKSGVVARLARWLAEHEEPDGAWTAKQNRGDAGIYFAFYAVDQPRETDQSPNLSPAAKLARTQRRLEVLVDQLEHAIANHDFEKARLVSDEEKKERDNWRRLRQEFNLPEPPARVPFLCIEVIAHEPLLMLQQRCDHRLAEGIAELWLLGHDGQRAYTVTKAEGLREFKGEVLRTTHPPLEMNLKQLYEDRR